VSAGQRHALLVATIVLGSFLSFSSEPMIGRLVVPFFGGAVHVWTVSMMVFQALLLGGYAWAHLVAGRIGGWHLLAMAVPLLWLPLGLSAEPAPDMPLIALIGTLLRHIALPFWALTTTAVVLQEWFARSDLCDRHDPYTLYAASNVGSLTALLCYPLLVEPLLGLTVQRWVWSAGWVVWWVLLAGTWWVLRREMKPEVPLPEGDPDELRPTVVDALKWLVLAAVPSALLLAVTQHLASEVGSFPLVWVLPLGLYLGSYILAFRDRDQSWLFEFWPEASVALIVLAIVTLPLTMFPVLLAMFFFACWMMHALLYARRPPPRWLTAFYLVVAAGGWLGGLAMSIGAPLLFERLVDVVVTTFALGLACLWVLGWPRFGWWDRANVLKKAGRLGIGVGLVGAWILLLLGTKRGDLVATHRNFYGVFEVRELPAPNGEPYRLIAHGRTIHGIQYVDADARPYPLSYYHEGGPLHVGLQLAEAPRQVGAVGLGAGAIAHWLEPGERMVFYEIDADNERIARQWFTFLDDSRGEVEVRVGDARLVLATEDDDTRYDVLFIDAFSGDAIPLHLLTVEAFETWLSRLADDGIIVFHLSNVYYDLRGVAARLAHHFGLLAAWQIGRAPPEILDDPLAQVAIGMVMSRDPADIDELVAQGWTRTGPGEPYPTDLWTDDWQNILVPLWWGWQLPR
jgi:hypothetical protein